MTATGALPRIGPGSDGGRAAQAAATLLLAIPWLWPFTSGPSPNVWPLLVAWCCCAVAAPLLLSADASRLPLALFASWLLAALASAGIGLSQWFGVAPDSVLVSVAGVGEAVGNLRQRNQFASLMNLGFAAVLWHAGRRLRPWHFAATATLAAANAASASRTGLLGAVAILLVVVLWPQGRRRRLALCLFLLVAYLAWALLLPQLLWHWRGLEPPNAFGRAAADLGCSSRRVLWSNVLYLIAQRPWTGWGPGELDFAHYMTLYPGDRFCDILDNAHNLPLHLAVEFGVPVAVVACAGVTVCLWRARPWQEADPARQMAWVGLLVIGLHSLVEYPLWYGPFQLAALGAVAVLIRAVPSNVQVRRIAAAAAVATLAGAAWLLAAYDIASQPYKPPEARRPAFRADPIAAAGELRVFGDQLRFAELSVTPLTRENAPHMLALARRVLHYSPEPPVIEKLIESATLLGYTEEAVAHAARYRAAFPERYARWRAASGLR